MFISENNSILHSPFCHFTALIKMIIRMYPTDGLKGQQAISPGQRLWADSSLPLLGVIGYIRIIILIK